MAWYAWYAWLLVGVCVVCAVASAAGSKPVTVRMAASAWWLALAAFLLAAFGVAAR